MLFDLMLRAAILAGIITYTKHIGVWDTTEQTEEIYNDTKKHVQPFVEQASKRIGYEIPPMPPKHKVSYLALYYYNCAVKQTFSILNYMPTHINTVLSAIPSAANKILMYGSTEFTILKERYDTYKALHKKSKKSEDTSDQSSSKAKIEMTPMPDAAIVLLPTPKTVKPATPQPEPQPKCERKFQDDFIYKNPQCRKQGERLPDTKCKCAADKSECKCRDKEVPQTPWRPATCPKKRKSYKDLPQQEKCCKKHCDHKNSTGKKSNNDNYSQQEKCCKKHCDHKNSTGKKSNNDNNSRSSSQSQHSSNKCCHQDNCQKRMPIRRSTGHRKFSDE